MGLQRHCVTMRGNLSDARRSLELSTDEIGKVESIIASLDAELGQNAAPFDAQQAVEVQDTKKKLSEQHVLAARLRKEAETLAGMIAQTQTQLVARTEALVTDEEPPAFTADDLADEGAKASFQAYTNRQRETRGAEEDGVAQEHGLFDHGVTLLTQQMQNQQHERAAVLSKLESCLHCISELEVLIITTDPALASALDGNSSSAANTPSAAAGLVTTAHRQKLRSSMAEWERNLLVNGEYLFSEQSADGVGLTRSYGEDSKRFHQRMLMRLSKLRPSSERQNQAVQELERQLAESEEQLQQAESELQRAEAELMQKETELRRLQYESLASLYDTKDASILAQKSLDMSVEDGLSTTPAPVTLNPQLKAKEMEAEQVEGAGVPQEAILEQLQRQRQDLEELTQQEELLLSQVERTRRDENCQDQAQEQVQQQAQRAVQPAMVNANGTGDAMSHAQISTLEADLLAAKAELDLQQQQWQARTERWQQDWEHLRLQEHTNMPPPSRITEAASPPAPPSESKRLQQHQSRQRRRTTPPENVQPNNDGTAATSFSSPSPQRVYVQPASHVHVHPHSADKPQNARRRRAGVVNSMHSHSTSLHASKKLNASKRLSVSELEQKLAAAQEKLEEAMRDEFVDPQSGLARNTAGQSQAKLEVSLISARDVPATKRISGKADPYVLLYLDAPEVIDEVNSDPMGEAAMTGYLERSETKQAELYPTWNQDYVVAGENAITSTRSQLRLILMDASRVGRDEMLGVTVVQLTELLDQRRHIDWYTVQPVSSKVRLSPTCAIRLRLRFLYSKVAFVRVGYLEYKLPVSLPGCAAASAGGSSIARARAAAA